MCEIKRPFKALLIESIIIFSIIYEHLFHWGVKIKKVNEK
ncbi:hypothetical protein AQPE_4547 [Aquipluma nitroreducens]|uniref:Uncharacterized protein n=1 Tax=Aquipluma nitroreducens TaxID=2010828 RepID=A0A5K7SFU7_9BACT|nr:hypothetical protein AQPE_4547 [Aquipluma nitroreducens]